MWSTLVFVGSEFGIKGDLFDILPASRCFRLHFAREKGPRYKKEFYAEIIYKSESNTQDTCSSIGDTGSSAGGIDGERLSDSIDTSRQDFDSTIRLEVDVGMLWKLCINCAPEGGVITFPAIPLIDEFSAVATGATLTLFTPTPPGVKISTQNVCASVRPPLFVDVKAVITTINGEIEDDP
ncbi:hypothetical protein M427DRAFT_50140 [Gonapodya prolifera JEL478]|uniref:Uncharacterized protein n=1 Tax=Gonapodya prolifera (strain JEL478) TaxID=1344416 RepID=A0A138ZXG0_GONPJ|nr:hypothetical protein M427DRAFT_50140 [Gonapodya prolifera JEL478]|eukprot:KXS08975.1 hypothetical protein M427DRAFT_50140 [Gonapodya prolifera JEL478]